MIIAIFLLLLLRVFLIGFVTLERSHFMEGRSTLMLQAWSSWQHLSDPPIRFHPANLCELIWNLLLTAASFPFYGHFPLPTLCVFKTAHDKNKPLKKTVASLDRELSSHLLNHVSTWVMLTCPIYHRFVYSANTELPLACIVFGLKWSYQILNDLHLLWFWQHLCTISGEFINPL